jgi:AAA+ superfamily predicted ATPase
MNRPHQTIHPGALARGIAKPDAKPDTKPDAKPGAGPEVRPETTLLKAPSAGAKVAPLPAEADELDVLIRARYAVIYVVSWEEARVEQHVRSIAERRGKEFYIWSTTTGLRKDGPGPINRAKGAAGPTEAMDALVDHKEPAIYLFMDLHAYLRPQVTCNVPVIRKLREVARALTDSYKTLIICSPLMEFAPELEKDVTVLDYPLPTAADVDGLLQRICHDVSEHSSIDVSLTQKERESLIRAAGGLTLQEAENVFAKTLVSDGKLTGDDVSTVFAEKQQIVRKSGLLEYYDSDAALSDVGGLDQLKDWLDRRSAAFTANAQAFGLPAPKGALLVGVQGCGKSLCAKAVSKAWNMPLLRFDVGRMFSSFIGSSEQNIRRAIAVAESIAPAVLWVDEIDKAFAGNSGSAGTDGGTSARVMSTFLTWLSEKSKPVFVLATANDISQLPPELLRKGRLDEIFFVDLPSAAERRVIFEIHLRKRRRNAGAFDLDMLAEAADGFSGAEVEQAVISALYDAFYLNRELTTADVLKSIRETVPLSRTMSERISSLRSWADGRARFASSTGASLAPAVRRKIKL